jgi:hypothetical protein
MIICMRRRHLRIRTYLPSGGGTCAEKVACRCLDSMSLQRHHIGYIASYVAIDLLVNNMRMHVQINKAPANMFPVLPHQYVYMAS